MRKTNVHKYIVVIVLLLLYLAPLIWILLSSFKTEGEMFSIPPTILKNATTTHYRDLTSRTQYPYYFLNSLVVAIVSTALSLLLGCPASYALTKHKFRGANQMLFGILALRMFPPIIFVLPFFFMLRALHLLDNRVGLIIAHFAFQLPLAIWLMRAFFLGVPKEIEEAAQIDGCSRIETFLRIAIPFVSPGIATTAIVNFLFSWNEFLFAVVITRMLAKTVPVFMAESITTFQVLWGQMFSSAVIFVTPVIIMAFLVQKRMVVALGGGFIKE
jgi:multiple sugar transport system permease protein